MALVSCQSDREPDLFNAFMIENWSNLTFENIYFFPYEINYASNDFRDGFTFSLKDALGITISLRS